MTSNEHAILLVEDNEDDVFLMRRALKNAGIVNPLYLAEDGEQAIDYLAGRGEFTNRIQFPYPFIIFLDLKLPRKSGFDVLAWMRTRKENSGPPVVVLSSSNSPDDMQRVTDLGAALCEIKPPTPQLFQRIGEQLGIEWLGMTARCNIPRTRAEFPGK